MPELPEVENAVRDLKPLLVGRRIVGVDITWPRIVALQPAEVFADHLIGTQIINADRRGKYLLFPLDSKDTLILHLRMTGNVQVVSKAQPVEPHTHAVFDLDNDRQFRYRDLRKFGRFYLVDDPRQVLGKLGPEPLSDSFTPIDLLQAVQGRRAPVKTLLLDQRVVAGIGNIYADEALFLAGLHPRRPGYSLTLADCSRLHSAIRQSLAQAIREGGSTLGDHKMSHFERPVGVSGRYQDRHQVFRRTGRPCRACGSPIERIKLGQRSTHYCPTCQHSNESVA